MSAIASSRFDHAWLRSRMAARRRPPSVVDGDFRAPENRTAYRKAAVLVPLVERENGLTVLLTRRTAHLRDHGGQISFPGGRVEESDHSVAHTALRETQEEIGLAPEHIEVLGVLDDYTTATAFRITPVVGLVHPPPVLTSLTLDAFEVDEVFELPLEHLFDRDNHQRNFIRQNDRMHHYYAIPYRDYYIWGATAAMLVNMCRFLTEGEAA